MLLRVSADGRLQCPYGTLRCALGRSGVRPDKREGDGATPIGRFPLRRAFYRPDRCPPPVTGLPLAALAPDHGWCDDPADALYNQFVRLPYSGRHERLWRTDGLYDLVVVIGWNDAPVVADRGSAIFLHCATADYAPTEGCVALARADLAALLPHLDEGACIEIGPRSSLR